MGTEEGRRCEEEGNGSSREERERRKDTRVEAKGKRGESEKEGSLSDERKEEWEKERKGKKKRETNDAKHMGLVSNVANYYVVKVGLCPLSVKGRPKDVSLAISNLYLVLFCE